MAEPLTATETAEVATMLAALVDDRNAQMVGGAMWNLIERAQMAVIPPPALNDVEVKATIDPHQVVPFLASVIKGGEGWSPQCSDAAFVMAQYLRSTSDKLRTYEHKLAQLRELMA